MAEAPAASQLPWHERGRVLSPVSGAALSAVAPAALSRVPGSLSQSVTNSAHERPKPVQAGQRGGGSSERWAIVRQERVIVSVGGPGRVIVRRYRKAAEGCIRNSESGMHRETTLQLNKRGYQGAFLFQRGLYDR